MLKFERYENLKLFNKLPDILNDSITGIVIENTLTHEEQILFKNVILELKDKFYNDLNEGNGFSLPCMFGQLYNSRPKELIETYFRQINFFREATNKAANLDFDAWLHNKLQSHFVPFNALPLPDFLPYSFRVVFPKRGGLFIHQDGQLLPYIHEEVSIKIRQHIVPETMMSWYFTLQDPESGGELWVADSKYFDYSKDGQFDMKSPEGKTITAENMDHIKVNTPTGSLLIFKGGSYWHKVIPPADNACDRITLGGFMAQGLDKQTIYYWS
jgi:hypothetical protein